MPVSPKTCDYTKHSNNILFKPEYNIIQLYIMLGREF